MEKVEHGAATSPHVHVEADARHLDASLLQLDLTAELSQLEGSEPFRLHGHGAKTLIKQPDLRVVLMVMKNGVSLGTHETKGRLTIQVLNGRISLMVGEQRVPLARGSLFALAPKLEHDVTALEQSAFLLTVAWPSTNL